ncbi:MAG TPA: cation diffusion facilitator family transporter [Nocardioidaceae bacterium]|nr:cation diffusion facilitator family transporter [Nocardioidaceae bacterium]
MTDGHGHGHAHGAHDFRTAAGEHRRRLVLVLLISLAILVAEVIGGFLSGSLALLADAAHMLTDVAGLTIALVAIALAQRPPTLTRTWGLARAEVLAAGLNALVLIAVGIWVLVEAVRRFADPPEIATGTMLVFGVVGLAGNAVAIWLLASAQRDSMNVRGAFLEVVSDAVASVGVLVAALLTRYTSLPAADTVVAVGIAVFILPRAVKLLREAVLVLLESTPRDVDLAEVRRHILEISRVLDVHDLHASTVTSGLPVLSAHVVVDGGCFHDGHAPQVLDQLQHCLAADFDVLHSTFQLEPDGHLHHEQTHHP